MLISLSVRMIFVVLLLSPPAVVASVVTSAESVVPVPDEADQHQCVAQLHSLVDLASSFYNLPLDSEPLVMKKLLQELTFLRPDEHPATPDEDALLFFAADTQTGAADALRRDLSKLLQEKIDFRPMLTSVITVLCEKFPHTRAPLLTLLAPYTSAGGVVEAWKSSSETRKTWNAFFAPLIAPSAGAASSGEKSNGNWTDGEASPGFLVEFVHAMFVQDLILAHRLADVETDEAVQRHVNAVRNQKFGVGAQDDGSVQFQKVRDGMPGTPVETDFKAKKLISVLSPCQGLTDLRRLKAGRRGEKGSWTESVEKGEFGNAVVSSEFGQTKFVYESLAMEKGETPFRTMLLNVKEAASGDVYSDKGNQNLGTALAISEIASLEVSSPMHAEYYIDRPRAEVIEVNPEELQARILNQSVTTTTVSNVGGKFGPDLATANLVRAHFSPLWVDMYSIWNLTFMVEYVGLRAVPVSALLLPTLLNAPSDLWGHGRANSLYLAINAVCVNFRDMRKPPQTALDTLGSRNSTENAVALRTAYGLPEAKMTSELAFADVFGLRENNQGPQHFWGAGVSTIFPLCKTDQEFRQFITKKCDYNDYVANKCERESSDLSVPWLGYVCERIPAWWLRISIPYNPIGPHMESSPPRETKQKPLQTPAMFLARASGAGNEDHADNASPPIITAAMWLRIAEVMPSPMGVDPLAMWRLGKGLAAMWRRIAEGEDLSERVFVE